MPTEAKRTTVAELREELANARTMIVSEYRGLSVREIAEVLDCSEGTVKTHLSRARDAVARQLQLEDPH